MDMRITRPWAHFADNLIALDCLTSSQGTRYVPKYMLTIGAFYYQIC